MPVWASVLITVIAAALSGGFGAWLVAWNDRHERFRDRMISAADDLVIAGSEGLIAVRDAIYQARHELAGRDQAVARAWKRRDVVLHRGARVELLFGPGSETARAVIDLTYELGKAIDRGQGPAPDQAAAEAAQMEAAAKLTSFQRAAFDGIRRAAPPSATMRESLRRALGR